MPPEEIGYTIGHVIGQFVFNYALVGCCLIAVVAAIFGASYALYVNIKQRRTRRATEHETRAE